MEPLLLHQDTEEDKDCMGMFVGDYDKTLA